MTNRYTMIAVALALGLGSTAFAQRGPGGPGNNPGGPGGPPNPGGIGWPGQPGQFNPDQTRKLQEEIEKLQAEIKNLANAMRQSKDQPQRKEGPGNQPKSGNMPMAKGDNFGPKGPPKEGFGPFAGMNPGKGGFGPFGGMNPGKGGFGGPMAPKGDFRSFGGPNSPKGDFVPPKSRRDNNVQALETHLDHLRAASQRINEQIKATEAQLRDAKAAEGRNRERPQDGNRPSGSVEQRLERIEKLLSELQNDSRRKR